MRAKFIPDTNSEVSTVSVCSNVCLLTEQGTQVLSFAYRIEGATTTTNKAMIAIVHC